VGDGFWRSLVSSETEIKFAIGDELKPAVMQLHEDIELHLGSWPPQSTRIISRFRAISHSQKLSSAFFGTAFSISWIIIPQ
jgi:hypothetical protein